MNNSYKLISGLKTFGIGITLVTLIGCGGQSGVIDSTARPWTYTDLGLGTFISAAPSGHILASHNNTTILISPSGTRTKVADAPQPTALVSASGHVVVGKTDKSGFEILPPGTSNYITAIYPTSPNSSYGSPLAVDSNGLVYGIITDTFGNNSLWVYSGPFTGSFASVPLPNGGTPTILGIDQTNVITFQINEGTGQDALYRYNGTFTKFQSFPLTNPQVSAIDPYGLVCGSNNLGGDLDGTAITHDESVTAAYPGLPNSTEAEAIGQLRLGLVIGNSKFSNNSVIATFWQSGDAFPLTDLVITTNTMQSVKSTTPQGSAIIQFQTPTDQPTLALVTPPKSANE